MYGESDVCIRKWSMDIVTHLDGQSITISIDNWIALSNIVCTGHCSVQGTHYHIHRTKSFFSDGYDQWILSMNDDDASVNRITKWVRRGGVYYYFDLRFRDMQWL
eukprot:149786_1